MTGDRDWGRILRDVSRGTFQPWGMEIVNRNRKRVCREAFFSCEETCRRYEADGCPGCRLAGTAHCQSRRACPLPEGLARELRIALLDYLRM